MASQAGLVTDIGCDLSVALKLWVIQSLHFEAVLQKEVLLNEHNLCGENELKT